MPGSPLLGDFLTKPLNLLIVPEKIVVGPVLMGVVMGVDSEDHGSQGYRVWGRKVKRFLGSDPKMRSFLIGRININANYTPPTIPILDQVSNTGTGGIET